MVPDNKQHPAPTSPASDSHRMIVRFPAGLHRRLKVLAAVNGQTMTAMIVEAVEAAVEIHEEAERGAVTAAAPAPAPVAHVG